MRIAALGVVVLVLLSVEGAARAGRSDAAWLYGTEVVPERGVELEQWIGEEHRQASDPRVGDRHLVGAG